MGSDILLQLLNAVRLAPLDEAAALRLTAYIIDNGAVSGPEAALIFRHLLKLNPAGVGWSAWGRLLNACGDGAAALTPLRRAVRATAWRAQTWSDYGNALHYVKSPLALTANIRALALAPSEADYLFNIGCDRQDEDRLGEAVRLLSRALHLSPDRAEIWARAAGLALQSGDLLLAKRRAACAIALDPASPAAANVTGMESLRRNMRRAATIWFRRALRVAPNFAEAQLNLALCDLEAGLLESGWRNYDARFASRGYREGDYGAPRWRGEPLAGKRLFVWREQGVGDEILFSSCFNDLVAAGAEVVALCDHRLVSLFSRSFPSIRFVADEQGVKQSFHYHAPMGSLPRYTRRMLAEFTIARTGAWLRPDSAATAIWRERLNALPPGLRIGLAWKSGLLTSDRRASYTALIDWLPLLKKAEINIINLQYGQCEEEISCIEQKYGVVVWRWADLDLKNDFEQIAALVSELDLVICPATAIGELAGALGVCVWRLGESDWTFLGAGVRPWYSAQRPILPISGAPLAGIPQAIAVKLDRFRSGPPKMPISSPEQKPRFEAALQAYRAGDLDAAANLCAMALGGSDADDRIRHLAAVVANRRGRPDEALALLRNILRRSAADPAATATLIAAGRMLAERALAMDQPEMAEQYYRRCIAVAPSDRALLVNMGAVGVKCGRPRQALKTLGWVLGLNADDAEAWSNYGLALERLGRDGEAEAAYRRAIAADSSHATSRDNLGMLLLKRGALRDGYALRDWRFSTPHFNDMVRASSAPLWRGENLAGKALFVWREQGIGDEIMFAACYGELAARAGRVIVQCDKRFMSLFSRSFPRIKFIPERAPPPPHDAQIPAGTLLRRLRGDLAAFPAQRSFLNVDPVRAAFWRARLAALGPSLKIGLAWRSKLVNSERKDAYIDVSDWEPVLRVPGVQFINLQYGDVGSELEQARLKLGVQVIHFDDLDLTNDLEGAAALMAELDLVFSPATSTAELAAAVGTPTWRLAPRDWTSLGTSVRPFFPMMRAWPAPPGCALAQTPAVMATALRRLMRTRDPAPPPVSAARMMEARAAFAAGRADQAAAAFATIITDDPQAASAWAGLGACRAELGEIGLAIAALERGLSLNPADPAALTTLGNVVAAKGRHGDGARLQRNAVRLAPDFSPAWDNLGVALLALGRDEEAAQCHRQALVGMSLSVGAWSNYAAALRSLGRFVEARQALANALTLSPDDPGVFAGLTQLLRRIELNPLAGPWMDRAARLAPSFPAIAFNQGLEMLRVGRLAAGWRGYERRFDAPELAYARPDFRAAAWRGESLHGKRLLVWGEQGVGDQLLFASVLPDLLGRASQEGGRVALAFDPRLSDLLASSFSGADIVTDIAAPGKVDYHCGVGSLAFFFRNRLADFSRDAPGYLRPDTVLMNEWRGRVAALPVGLRVGVAWRSGLMTGDRLPEYFQLADLAPLLADPQIVAVNLQYAADVEIGAAISAGVRIIQWPDLDLKNDFSAVAALIAQLDLVIAPATAVAELSAALGTATWRLSSFGDWTRLGTNVRPWLPAQKTLTPRNGETIRDLSRRIANLLKELTQQTGHGHGR